MIFLYPKFLIYLDLSENNIIEISGLGNLSNLKTLKLSANKIKKIKGLDNLANLKKLDLDCNKISRLENAERLKHIKMINLDGNPIPDEELDKLGGKRYGKTIYQNLDKKKNRKKIIKSYI